MQNKVVRVVLQTVSLKKGAIRFCILRNNIYFSDRKLLIVTNTLRRSAECLLGFLNGRHYE